MAERCDYYSDDEYQQALQMEQEEQQRMMQEAKDYDQYTELLNELELTARQLGYEHAISYLKSLLNTSSTAFPFGDSDKESDSEDLPF